MKPNISGARIATSKLGSASPAAGTPIMPVTVSKGRAQRGLRSTDGATAPAGEATPAPDAAPAGAEVAP